MMRTMQSDQAVWLRLAVVVGIVLMTVGACTRGDAVGSAANAYRCDDGVTLLVTPGQDFIALELTGGAPQRLARVVSASGAKYSDGEQTFWSKGDEAILEVAGLRRSCTLASDTTQ